MQKKMLICLSLLLVVPGLLFFTSCAKKTVESSPVLTQEQPVAQTDSAAEELLQPSWPLKKHGRRRLPGKMPLRKNAFRQRQTLLSVRQWRPKACLSTKISILNSTATYLQGLPRISLWPRRNGCGSIPMRR